MRAVRRGISSYDLINHGDGASSFYYVQNLDHFTTNTRPSLDKLHNFSLSRF